MMNLILLLCILITSSFAAQDVCQLRPGSFEKKVRINEIPGFFFKVHPSGNYVSYIGEDLNMLLDMASGKSYVTAERGDPVWSPDGKFLSTINMDTLKFYKGDDYIDASKRGKPNEAQSFVVEIPGVYQSIALSGTGYKVVTDEGGVSIANLDSQGKLTSKVRKPCQNISHLPTDLPMISKDGRFLSVFDSKSKSTKIYNIESDQCNLALDLGFPTGKVSFNSDSSQISFHLDQFSLKDEDGYFSGIDRDKVKNVVVLNLDHSDDEKKLTPSTWALASKHSKRGDGGYYPDFDAKGNLYYLEDVGNFFEFVKVNPSDLEFRNFTPGLMNSGDCVSCGSSPELKSSSIIAKIWTDICQKVTKMSMSEEKSLIAAIDPELCLKMVEDYWTPSLGQSKEELQKICPAKPVHEGSTLGVWDETRIINAQSIINSKCIVCHSVPINYEVERKMRVMTSPDNFELETVKIKGSLPAFKKDETDLFLIAKMKIALENQSMPKGEDLATKDMKIMSQYFYRKLLDVPSDVLRYSSTALFDFRYDEEALKVEREDALRILPPNSSDAIKKDVVLEVNCTYGKKDCQEYLKSKIKQFKLEAEKLPQEKRAKYIEKNVMFIKCEALIETTFDQCLKWKIDTFK